MRRREIAPDDLDGAELPFGWYRMQFRERPSEGQRIWEARRGPLRVRIYYRPGGRLNWIASAWFHWLDVDPELAEGQDPSVRIATSDGKARAREALSEAYRLSVVAFGALAGSLGYEVRE